MISILVVDDNHNDRSFLCNLLEKNGYKCYPVDNIESAITFIKESIPDLIILSIQTNGLVDLKAIKKIKQSKKGIEIPVLFHISEINNKLIAKGLKLGAIDYISKPFIKEEILSKLTTQIDLKTLKNKNKEYKSVNEELVKAKAKFTETERSYIALFKHSHTIMLLIDPLTGNIIDVNKEAINYYGYSYKQICQMNINQINTLSDTELKKELKRAKDGNSNLFYFQHKLANNSIRDVEVYSSSIVSNNRSILLSIIHDITDRKKAEQELKNNEKLLKEVADNYPHSYISIIEKDFTVSLAAGQEFKSFGLNPKDYIGQSLDKIFGKSASFIKSKYLQAFKGEACSFELYIFGQHQYYQATPLTEDGKVNRILVVAENITERKKTEIELLEAKQVAVNANLAKSRFLSNMSHELRTPLTSILGYNQLLKEDQNITAEQKDQIDAVLKSGKHLLDLINDILDFSKIEAGKHKLVTTDFNLPDLIKEVINITKINAEGKNLYFYYNTIGKIPEIINGDNRKIKQILINILSNAVKFTNKGGVNFTVESKKRKKNEIIFRVEDSGVGISPEEMKYIFEPFNQLGRKYNSGTGLGLIITKKLTELMKGKLSISSSIDGGSCFKIELPLNVKSKQASSLGSNQIPSNSINNNQQLAIKIPNETILDEILLEIKKGDYNKLEEIIRKLKKEDKEFIFFCDKIKNYLSQYNEHAIIDYIKILKSNLN